MIQKVVLNFRTVPGKLLRALRVVQGFVSLVYKELTELSSLYQLYYTRNEQAISSDNDSNTILIIMVSLALTN